MEKEHLELELNETVLKGFKELKVVLDELKLILTK
jgi:hypothetical protein